jgi:hypothetical protein
MVGVGVAGALRLYRNTPRSCKTREDDAGRATAYRNFPPIGMGRIPLVAYDFHANCHAPVFLTAGVLFVAQAKILPRPGKHAHSAGVAIALCLLGSYPDRRAMLQKRYSTATVGRVRGWATILNDGNYSKGCPN